MKKLHILALSFGLLAGSGIHATAQRIYNSTTGFIYVLVNVSATTDDWAVLAPGEDKEVTKNRCVTAVEIWGVSDPISGQYVKYKGYTCGSRSYRVTHQDAELYNLEDINVKVEGGQAGQYIDPRQLVKPNTGHLVVEAY